MTEIKRLKNKFLKFNKEFDYSVFDNGQGKNNHIIYSEELKQSLREIVHSKASEEWQIKHALGENFVEYRIEQDGEFGLYRKNLTANSPDEFLVTLEGQNSPEREEFTSAARACEEARRKTEIARKQIEMIRQKNSQGNKGLENNTLGENYISITLQKDEEGRRLITKEEHYSDPSQKKKIQAGWSYNFTKEMLSEWAQKQKDKNSQIIIQKVIKENADEESEQIKTENSDKKSQKSEKETDQQISLPTNKENSKNIYYGVGLVSLVLLVISMVVVCWIKSKVIDNKNN